MKQGIYKFICALLLVASLSACTGSQHKLVNVSNDDLSRINKEISQKKNVYPIYNRSDAANRALVTRAHNRLLGRARSMCDYTGYTSCFFQTIYNPGHTVNAYAHDNNKITIYRGLLQYLRTEDEVAMVVAHEMGHHLANHNQEKRQNAMVGAAVTGLLTAVIIGAANHNNPYYSPQQQQRDQQTIRDMTMAGAAIGAVAYSKEEEREADLLGQYLMAKAGYDMRKAERTLWLMMSLKASQGVTADRSAFGDTHPAGPERIASWRNVIAEIKSNPSKLPYKLGNPSKRQEPENVAKRTDPKKSGETKVVASGAKGSAFECLFSWQKAKDGTRCGKRAVPTKQTRQNAFSE